MSELSLSAEKLVRFLFIHVSDVQRPGEDSITIECNYCSDKTAVFYEGPDTSLPDTDWLATAATHVAEHHKSGTLLTAVL